MDLHIVHATATFAELTLAMSIAALSKIVPIAKITDSIARETTVNRLRSDEGKIVAFGLGIVFWFNDKLKDISTKVPIFSFLCGVFVLFEAAYCTSKSGHSASFWISFSSFLLMLVYLITRQEQHSKTSEEPLIEPVP
jgi:RsiW-degrading membrane proteinase PrsW (M82 family)